MSNLLCKRTVGASSKETLSEAQEAARDLVTRILRVH
jgi:hypothetical protein